MSQTNKAAINWRDLLFHLTQAEWDKITKMKVDDLGNFLPILGMAKKKTGDERRAALKNFIENFRKRVIPLMSEDDANEFLQYVHDRFNNQNTVYDSQWLRSFNVSGTLPSFSKKEITESLYFQPTAPPAPVVSEPIVVPPPKEVVTVIQMPQPKPVVEEVVVVQPQPKKTPVFKKQSYTFDPKKVYYAIKAPFAPSFWSDDGAGHGLHPFYLKEVAAVYCQRVIDGNESKSAFQDHIMKVVNKDKKEVSSTNAFDLAANLQKDLCKDKKTALTTLVHINRLLELLEEPVPVPEPVVVTKVVEPEPMVVVPVHPVADVPREVETVVEVISQAPVPTEASNWYDDALLTALSSVGISLSPQMTVFDVITHCINIIQTNNLNSAAMKAQFEAEIQDLKSQLAMESKTLADVRQQQLKLRVSVTDKETELQDQLRLVASLKSQLEAASADVNVKAQSVSDLENKLKASEKLYSETFASYQEAKEQLKVLNRKAPQPAKQTQAQAPSAKAPYVPQPRMFAVRPPVVYTLTHGDEENKAVEFEKPDGTRSTSVENLHDYPVEVIRGMFERVAMDNGWEDGFIIATNKYHDQIQYDIEEESFAADLQPLPGKKQLTPRETEELQIANIRDSVKQRQLQLTNDPELLYDWTEEDLTEKETQAPAMCMTMEPGLIRTSQQLRDNLYCAPVNGKDFTCNISTKTCVPSTDSDINTTFGRYTANEGDKDRVYKLMAETIERITENEEKALVEPPKPIQLQVAVPVPVPVAVPKPQSTVKTAVVKHLMDKLRNVGVSATPTAAQAKQAEATAQRLKQFNLSKGM